MRSAFSELKRRHVYRTAAFYAAAAPARRPGWSALLDRLAFAKT